LDIREWLQGLELERYAEAFSANEIDAQILPKLTAEDLKDLGVALVGHRRKLLEAIATLHDGVAVEVPNPTAPTPRTAAIEIARAEAERRQLTVMFCDLVGSTALSARLDPEEMREVIRAYHNAVAGEITRFEGHVAKFMGDGVLAYFGWPRAHEDEAERAVRAGLAITAAIGQLNDPAGEALAARVGIATGLVVVGDLVGEGAAQEEAVVGETPNLAARLQGIAAPGQVVIADATQRLLGAGFELQELGEQGLKGISEPVQPFAVIAERPVESRFEARSGPSLMPMVGRDQELALLLERWALAKAGEGQGVLLVGEAGIGKSRVSRALFDAVAEEPHFRVRYQCSPYHTDSALWPVIQQLTYAADLGAEDPLELKLDKLEALLERAGGRAAAPLIADLLGLDGAARYGPLDLTPQIQRTRTLQALAEQLLGLAARRPVLVALEDGHWIDPTTLELIEQGLDRIGAARVLILLTSRPDHQPALAGHPHVTRLTLNRLGRTVVETIVARLGGEHLPGATIAAIIARTDGVPLFVEELTKAVLETGEATIPASLHDSLMARLDRIPEVKEVAQIAACIGREFDYALLAAVADRPEPDLQSSLDKLATAELIFRRGTPPAASYTFKHALVQDAAHESLLKSRRRALHAQIAEVLETRFPQSVDGEPELLAQHYAAAGLTEPAVRYWQKAGARAIEHSAYEEALAHLTRGLDALRTLPDTEQHARQELDLQIALGVAIKVGRGFTAAEMEPVYSRACELSERLGETEKLVYALRGLWAFDFVAGQWERGRRLAEQAISAVKDTNDSVALTVAHYIFGSTLFYQGELISARRQLEAGVVHYERRCHETDVLISGQDTGVITLNNLSLTLCALGYPDSAKQVAKRSLDRARKLVHPFSLALALTFGSHVRTFRREWHELAVMAEELSILSSDYDFPFYKVVGVILRGMALAAQGESATGISEIRRGLAEHGRMGVQNLRLWFTACLAEILKAEGRIDEGLELLAEALEAVRKGERVYEAEVHRLVGELLLLQPSRQAEGEAHLVEALEITRHQDAKWWELRAASSLACFWAKQGEPRKAYDLLAPVYDWFTEGFDTADLRDARALLDQLQ
jgi:class 3 adenylate cyclase/tetratricopeptide (TPR) repeat protein